MDKIEDKFVSRFDADPAHTQDENLAWIKGHDHQNHLSDSYMTELMRAVGLTLTLTYLLSFTRGL